MPIIKKLRNIELAGNTNQSPSNPYATETFKSFTLQKFEIPCSDEVKYLGVRLDRAFTWKPHANNTYKKAKADYAQLLPLINS